jgi:hypothetical protein
MPVRNCHRTFYRDLLLRSSFIVALTLLVSSPSFAVEETPVVPASPSTSISRDASTAVNGYLSGRYVYRTASYSGGKTSDQDLFGDLRLDVTRPKDNRYEFHFLGSVRSDLDGNQDVSAFNPLDDIGDTYGTRTIGYLYEANVVLNEPLQHLTKVRIGRQSGTRDEPVVFDGVAMDMGSDKVNVTLYGGAAMHFYEVNWHWGKDTLEGAGLDYTPRSGTGMSVDFLAVKDKREFTPEDATVYDRMVSLKVWQQFEPYTRVAVKYRYLDGEPRDLSLKASTVWQAANIDATASYFRQFRPQNELTTDLSLYYDVIGVSAPYQSVDIKVRKFFAERVAVDLGYFKRELLDSSDQGPFNKDFWRAYFDVEVMDLLLNNLSGMLLLEQWDSQGRSYDAVGADLSYKIKKNKKEARISIGTNYSLYKYDYYTELGVREQVRTWYLTGKYPLINGFSVNGGYEYEHSFEKYQTLRLGMRYDF